MTGFEMTESELRDYCKRIGVPCPLDESKPKSVDKHSKYGNQRTEFDGDTYDSKHEAKRAAEIKLMMKAGEIAGWARQVRFALPGGITYVADFVVFAKDGKYTVEDAKSEATRRDKVYVLKRKLMKHEWNIDIVEV